MYPLEFLTRPVARQVLLILLVTCWLGSASQSVRSVSAAMTSTQLTINLASRTGSVNPFVWGINAPDKQTNWAGSSTVEGYLQQAGIKIIRVGALQYALYHSANKSICTTPTSCDFTQMDADLKSVFDSGAQPLFVVAGYPGGGITQYDWTDYASFMKTVVTRYNVDLVLGHKVLYWEMWNEPTDEADGTIPDKATYANFVKTVGGAMKGIDSSIKLVACAAPWADLGSGGWVDYTAKNTNNLVDILSWHDYGSGTYDDQARLVDTSRYTTEVADITTGSGLLSSDGKRYQAALTEYNMAWQSLSSGNNQYYHSAYTAVYDASTIIEGLSSGATIFTNYAAMETGTNNLGLLANSGSYTPYAPYYTFYEFGNFMQSYLLATSSTASNLQYVASISSDGQKVTVIAVNQNMTASQTITLALNGASTGSYTSYTLDDSTLPTSGTSGSLQQGQLTATLPALSVVSFVINLSTTGTSNTSVAATSTANSSAATATTTKSSTTTATTKGTTTPAVETTRTPGIAGTEMAHQLNQPTNQTINKDKGNATTIIVVSMGGGTVVLSGGAILGLWWRKKRKLTVTEQSTGPLPIYVGDSK